jgi:hypothetical protein
MFWLHHGLGSQYRLYKCIVYICTYVVENLVANTKTWPFCEKKPRCVIRHFTHTHSFKASICLLLSFHDFVMNYTNKTKTN